jgi:DNA-binding NarL/FixJ family response regulator
MKLGNLKILLVDNSETVKKRIREMLKEINNVSIIGEASNCKEALIITEIMNPDLVMLDLDLPEVNGVEVLKKIKKDFQHIQVMILTNYSQPNHRTRCHEAGADYFFDKTTEFEKVPELLLSLTKFNSN